MAGPTAEEVVGRQDTHVRGDLVSGKLWGVCHGHAAGVAGRACTRNGQKDNRQQLSIHRAFFGSRLQGQERNRSRVPPPTTGPAAGRLAASTGAMRR